MNTRYPDATTEDLTRDSVCIICREEMKPYQRPEDLPPGGDDLRRRATSFISLRMRPKKLPCGHILHLSCLRSWLERQQNCPICRRPVLDGSRAAAQAQGAGANPQGAANGGHNPAVNNQGGGQNRARIFNLGPFRVGFGAGQGNLFRDLAQGVHNGQLNPNAPPAPNPDGRQQLGIGFGFGRRPAPQLPALPAPNGGPELSHADMQAQILRIEQQLMRDINRLRATADQLQTVRGLQSELARLRNQQANPQATNIPQPMINPQGRPNIPFFNPPRMNPTPIQTAQQFASHPQAPEMTAGHQNLPPGVTIPEGWKVLPLRKVDHVRSLVPGQGVVSSVRPPQSMAPGGPSPSAQQQTQQPVQGGGGTATGPGIETGAPLMTAPFTGSQMLQPEQPQQQPQLPSQPQPDPTPATTVEANSSSNAPATAPSIAPMEPSAVTQESAPVEAQSPAPSIPQWGAPGQARNEDTTAPAEEGDATTTRSATVEDAADEGT